MTTPNSAALALQLRQLTEQVRLCCNDPADAVRLLTVLAGYNVPIVAAAGTALGKRLSAIASVCRRAALASLARACATYSPASSGEAQATLAAVLAAFDAEILRAADAGQGAATDALRRTRGAVAADLNRRCAQLPNLREVKTAIPATALATAYRLYADALRADELTLRSGANCALFLPTSYEALSK